MNSKDMYIFILSGQHQSNAINLLGPAFIQQMIQNESRKHQTFLRNVFKGHISHLNLTQFSMLFYLLKNKTERPTNKQQL